MFEKREREEKQKKNFKIIKETREDEKKKTINIFNEKLKYDADEK